MFGWLPLVVAAFALTCRLRPAAAPALVLAVSVLFVLADGAVSLAFLAASILGNLAAARAIGQMAPGSTTRRLALTGAIILNLAPLIAYKWTPEGAAAFDVNRRDMPLGLAFYTLQQITYLVLAMKPHAPQLGIVRHAAWGTFFAQLPAGPIGAYGRMAPQYERMGLQPPAAADIARGLTLVLAGIVKKTWIADPLARVVDSVLAGAGAPTALEAWTVAWGYMLQLYFDFSAYSDIAIGIGLCFGLSLPLNFDSPLKSKSPGQYVMRWHVSLMTFVRDHVFEPMFKAVRRAPIRSTTLRYGLAWASATIVAYLAIAAWHTLALAPLVQGLVAALVLIVVQFRLQASRAGRGSSSPLEAVLRGAVGQVLLLATVAVFALFLRLGHGQTLATMLAALVDLDSLATVLRQTFAYLAGVAGLADPAAAPKLLPGATVGGPASFFLIAAATVVALGAPNTMQIFAIPGVRNPATPLRWTPSAAWGWATGALLFLAVVGLTRSGPTAGFVYAQF